MSNSKDQITEVFDQLASTRSWETLYSGEVNRMSYNFITRQRAVEQLLASHASGMALDIGCGSGDLVRFYTDNGVRYEGMDLSPHMIERAEKNYADLIRDGKAAFRVADCEQLPFADGAFDVVSAVALIEYLPDATKALDEMVRVTRSGGYLVITVPNKRCINTRIRNGLQPIRDLLFPLYVKLRKASLSSMKDVIHYSYTQDDLDRLMQERGLAKVSQRFTNFHCIPHPLDHLVPKLYMKISDAIIRRGRDTSFRNWASNYIALYRKK